MKRFSPGAIRIGSSMAARKSKPAEPSVSYWGRGKRRAASDTLRIATGTVWGSSTFASPPSVAALFDLVILPDRLHELLFPWSLRCGAEGDDGNRFRFEKLPGKPAHVVRSHRIITGAQFVRVYVRLSGQCRVRQHR